MASFRASAVLVGCVLALGTLAAQARPRQEARVDLRSLELIRLDCASGEFSRELVLFANGTVRIRDRNGPQPGVRLAELEPPELEGFRARFAEIDLKEVPAKTRGPSGETLEQCLLRLELKSGEVAEYRFTSIVALPLALSRLLGVIDDLRSLAEERQRLSSGLSGSYRPRVGDVLIKADGSRHRIVRITAEGAGVEILGLESPLVLYLPKEGVRGEFVAVESRRGSQAQGDR